MKKLEVKKQFKECYAASSDKFSIVNIPEMNFLTVSGKGDPNTSTSFKEAVELIYTFAYSIKFMFKKGPEQIDYGVMPLEGLWWSEDISKFSVDKKDEWQWKIMIMQPAIVTEEYFNRAVDQVKLKKTFSNYDRIKFESFREGLSAQTLHLGPFEKEGPTIENLHSYIYDGGYKPVEKHHEIYLSDIRRAAPEKWKTIIRQPIMPK